MKRDTIHACLERIDRQARGDGVRCTFLLTGGHVLRGSYRWLEADKLVLVVLNENGDSYVEVEDVVAVTGPFQR